MGKLSSEKGELITPRKEPKIQIKRYQAALLDLGNGFASVYIWPMLGWLDVKQRYRRSVIGPFWLTISTAVMIGCMGPLYGKLFGTDISSYFGYFSIGFIVWMFLSSLISDSCTVFTSSAGFLQQMKMPYSIYALKMVYRNLIIFMHNFLIIIVVLLFYLPPISFITLLWPLGVFLIALNAVWMGIVLGLICARFRDVQQIVQSLIQLGFFLTPIIWKPEMLGKYSYLVYFNPFYYFIEIVRAPLISGSTRALDWVVVLGITIFGYLVMLYYFARYRSQISYWV